MIDQIAQSWLDVWREFVLFLSSFPTRAGAMLWEGTADVPKSLVLVLMIGGLWSISIPRIRFRPVRDFTLWAFRYPVPSVVLLSLMLIVWGVVGKGFGMQDLFLENNPLIAFELGVLLSLLVLSLIVQYFILDAQGFGWMKSLEIATRTVLVVASWLPPWARAFARRALGNELFQQLNRDRCAAILGEIEELHEEHHAQRAEANSELSGVLKSPWFRLLFAPAVVATYAIPEVMLVGVFPLFVTDAAQAVRVAAWFLGVSVGALAAVWLTGLTTARIFEFNKGAWDAPYGAGLSALDAARSTADAADGAGIDLSSRGHWRALGRSICVAFLLIHLLIAVVSLLFPHRIQLPGVRFIPNSGWGALSLELTLALLIAGLIHWRWLIPESRRGSIAPLLRIGRYLRDSRTGRLIQSIRVHPEWVILAALVILTAVVGYRIWLAASSPDWEQLAWAALVALLAAGLLAVYFMIWVVPFHVATAANSRQLSSFGMILAALCVALGLAFLANAANWTHHWVAAICASVAIVALIAPVPAGRRKAMIALIVVLGVNGAFVPFLLPKDARPVVWALIASSLLCIALIMSGSAFLRRLASMPQGHRSREGRSVGRIYPASSVLAFVAFATFYAGLPERIQSFLPAGASLALVLGTVAALYMLVKFSSNRGSILASLVILVPLLLNGNAWLVEPNQYKLQFPGMEEFYPELGGRDNPAYFPAELNSQAYFRSTTSSVVKLFSQDYFEEWSEGAGKRVERLPRAIVYQPRIGLDPKTMSPRLLLELKDKANCFRAAAGDRLALYIVEKSLSIENANGSLTLKLKAPRLTNVPGGFSQPVRLKHKFWQWTFRNCSALRLRFDSAVTWEQASDKGTARTRSSLLECRKVPKNGGPSFVVAPEGDDIEIKLTGVLMPPLPVQTSARVAAVFEKLTLERTSKLLPDSPLVLEVGGLEDFIDDQTLKSVLDAEHIKGAVRDQLDESHLVLTPSEWPPTSGGTTKDCAVASGPAVLPGTVEGQSVGMESSEPSVALARYEDAVAWARKTDEDTKSSGGGGDCYVLEHYPSSSREGVPSRPITLGTFAVGSEQFQNLPTSMTLSAESLRDIVRDRLHVEGENPPPNVDLSLRTSYRRGIYQGHPRELAVDLARGERVRDGDLLILRWPGEHQGDLPESATVRIARVGPARRGISRVELDLNWERAPGQRADTLRERREAREFLVGKHGTWEILSTLDNQDVLEAWKDDALDTEKQPAFKKAVKANGTRSESEAQSSGELSDRAPLNTTKNSRPPLVVVAVSGGGIRASVWTATVLASLERDLGPTFPYHVRLITGASGGMVSAAHYVASLPSPAERRLALEAGKEARDLARWVESLAEDQLNSVAGCLAFNDIPALLNPVRRGTDRGRRLEETWKRITADGFGDPNASKFARSLRDLAAGERAGWCPSLIFTPMMVEDGRRLLISNLDLGFATRNYGRLLMEWDTETRKVDPTYVRDLRPREPYERANDALYSLSAVEFFRLFPNAARFQISTAARMSATFPFVSPAASLPTKPPRRVVDAGYYDNYGVNIAAQWLTEMRDWIEDNTSGVLIIQIRDSVSQDTRSELGFDVPKETESTESSMLPRLTWNVMPDVLDPGAYPITTPLNGISNAREWSMSFRNDEQIELFDELMSARKTSRDDPDFFRTVVFECPVPASTSWKLTNEAREKIRRGMGLEFGDDLFRNVMTFQVREDIQRRQLLANVRYEQDKQQSPTDAVNNYMMQLNSIYLEELKKLRFDDPATGAVDGLGETKKLYTNVFNNMRRRELVRDWWFARMPK
ncbi:patatin-like phospholipase family protein [Aquisphaera insulae]|uniref:patatin-like phospholipase family protein n=1 Tax=Aquisphaera insulae TaxID=2712864 RepID=UPI0013EB5020|nr:patatin-like phospholipase family protein [Aquisphaera insulae]